ncbi:hypothetical protein EMCRGX_G024280 [Ephydatia muelleri]
MSLQCEWDFLQRVVPVCADAFTPLNKKIKKQFIPAMLGAGVNEAEEALFALPTSLAGIGIFDPTKTATLAYQTSRQGTEVLVEAVKGVVVFDPAQHLETLRAARKHHVNIKEETYQSVLDSVDTVREPIVREAETKVGDSGLRLDLGVRSVWQSQAEALFDFKVIDTDAPSSRVLVDMKHVLCPELYTFIKSATPHWKVDIASALKMTHVQTKEIISTSGLTQQSDYFQEMLHRWLKWATLSPPLKTWLIP